MKKTALATLCLTVAVLPKSIQAMQTRVSCEKEPLKLTVSIPPATPINPETAAHIIKDAPAHIRLATICERCCTASEAVALISATYMASGSAHDFFLQEENSSCQTILSEFCQSALCLFMASICHGGAKEYREIKHSWQNRLAVAAPQAAYMGTQAPDGLSALLAAEKAPR